MDISNGRIASDKLIHISNTGCIAFDGWLVIFTLDIVLAISLLVAIILLFRKIIPATKAKKGIPKKVSRVFYISTGLALLSFALIWHL